MRKRKFVCGMFALCLALSMAGCGKSPEERQAANYYQNELGLDKEEAEELAHELYGEDEEEPSVAEEVQEEIVVEPLPELVNSEWFDRKVQIYDMVFDNDWHLTEEDIRKIVEGSAYDVEIVEDFDKNGDVYIKNLKVNGEYVNGRELDIDLHTIGFPDDVSHSHLEQYGWFDDGSYYHIPPWVTSNCVGCYNKQSIEFADLDLKTRDDVLAYLSENGFVEVEEEQACYRDFSLSYTPVVFSDRISVEYADTPHYYCQGVQSIELYRMHKLDETDREIEILLIPYSGARLYLVDKVYFSFNTDGTIENLSDSLIEVMVIGAEIQ